MLFGSLLLLPETPTAGRGDIENCDHEFGALPLPPPLSEPHRVLSNSQVFLLVRSDSRDGD